MLENNGEERTEYGNFSELEIRMNRQFLPKYSYSSTRQGSSNLGKTAHTEMTCYISGTIPVKIKPKQNSLKSPQVLAKFLKWIQITSFEKTEILKTSRIHCSWDTFAILRSTYCGLQRHSTGAHGITHCQLVTALALMWQFCLLYTTLKRFQNYTFIWFHLQPQLCRGIPVIDWNLSTLCAS